MRYIQIGSKFLYFLGAVIALGSVIFLAYLGTEVDLTKSNGKPLMIVVLVFSPYSFYLFYTNVFKSIYASIDTKSQVLRYGNVLFNQEVSLEDVKVIGRRFLSRSTRIIEILGKRYYMGTHGEDIQTIIESHKKPRVN
jgi:hypothetical protein